MSTRRMAPCAPAFGVAVTATATVLLSGSRTDSAERKVPSLPRHTRLCRIDPAGPLVRVIFTWYVSVGTCAST
ncbi:hypothetical protein F8274_27715 [Micromonospora sp. AMSO31t]|nr:hypothetical protein [Micromonospora sp. AMSO31t]KAB1904936.1 hypothetical protein F8274_27715 [Micromonospora sp. AMSO31t]